MTYTEQYDIEAMAEAYHDKIKGNRNPLAWLNPQNVSPHYIAGYNDALAASPVHAELARLKQRLQMDWIYNHRGEPEPWTDGMPDAIDTLEQMVERIQRDNERLRAELARAKAECERLQDNIDHLMRCKEFESNLQLEILAVGGPLLKYPDGKTYCSGRAWEAIKQALEQKGVGDD